MPGIGISLRMLMAAAGQGDAAESENWLTDGVTASDVYAAYEPDGAATLSESYVNQNDPGTNDAVVGVAPTLDGGWVFNGSTQYLDSGFVADNDQSQTIIAFVENASGTGWMVGANNGTDRWIGLRTLRSSGAAYYNGNYREANASITTGTLALAGSQIYRMGEPFGSAIGVWGGASSYTMYIGAVNGGSAASFWQGKIKKLYIYNVALTDAQVLAIAKNVDGITDAVARNAITHTRQRAAYYYNGVTYVAWMDWFGNYKIRTFTHSTGTWSSAVTIDSSAYGQGHDHGEPSVWVVENDATYAGRVLVAVSIDSGDGGDLTIYRSDSAEDISAWTQVHTIAGSSLASQTYPKLIEVSDGTVWLFYRAGDDTEKYITSTDGGGTWSGVTQLVSFNSYARFVVSGDEIHAAFNYYDGSDYLNIYHMYSDDAGANWKHMDGTAVTLPAGTGDLDAVHTTGVGEETRDSDLILVSGTPYILFVDDWSGDNTVTRAAWNSGTSSWDTETIVNTVIVGSSANVPFATFEPGDADTVYVPIDTGSGQRITPYTGSGGTWSAGTAISEPVTGDAFWPVHVINGVSALRIIYAFSDNYADHDAGNWGQSYILSYPAYDN